jgi:hypothetical protein
MSDLITALSRLRAFRSTWADDARIDEESELPRLISIRSPQRLKALRTRGDH